MGQDKEYTQRPPSLLDLPYDGASSFMRGAAEAPSRIRAALRCDSTNMWTESGIDLGAKGILHDSGYIQPGPMSEPDDMLGMISDGARRVIDGGHAPVFLGGDHSVTYPAFKGLVERISPVSILHFDAHPDLYDKFEGRQALARLPFRADHGGGPGEEARAGRYPHGERPPARAGREVRRRDDHDEGPGRGGSLWTSTSLSTYPSMSTRSIPPSLPASRTRNRAGSPPARR